MSTKRPGSILKFTDTSLDKNLKTTEEFDCERRGYKLTKTCLGAGAYAKVKLAYVSNAKLEKDKRLADELKEKGTNKVELNALVSHFNENSSHKFSYILLGSNQSNLEEKRT